MHYISRILFKFKIAVSQIYNAGSYKPDFSEIMTISISGFFTISVKHYINFALMICFFLLLSPFLKEGHYRHRIYYKIDRNIYTGLIYILFKNET